MHAAAARDVRYSDDDKTEVNRLHIGYRLSWESRA